MSSPANRTALRDGGEPAGAAQPAGQRQRGERPDPVEPLGQDSRAGQVPGGVQQLVPQRVELVFQAGSHGQGGGDLPLPGRRQVRGRGRAGRGQARRCRAGCPRRGPGRPGGRTPRGCAAPRRCARGAGRGRPPAAPGTPGPARGGIQHSGSRPSASSCRRCRESVLSVLACRLRPRANAVSAGSARCTPIPAAASSAATYRHPVQPSIANAASPSRPANRASQARRCSRSAGATCPRLTCPDTVSR